MTERIPEPIDRPRAFESTIEMLLLTYKKHKESMSAPAQTYNLTAKAERYACGYPLPPFQRPERWTELQQQRFIESAFLGFYLGTYTIHEMNWTDSKNAEPTPFSGWLIDGQQRLISIQKFFEDKIRIFDAALCWSDLTEREKQRFLRVKFTHEIVCINDEHKIRELYNRLSFGGVPHDPSERA